jgi:hypothetical protein
VIILPEPKFIIVKHDNPFEHCESVYWVFTQLCNDTCDHCYNLSGPQGERMSEDACMQIIENLPAEMNRLILSGGEPLAERRLLYRILEQLRERKATIPTQIMLQTNGDLLTGEILDRLIELGVTRFDISSIDRYHKHAGSRLMDLAELFASRGVSGDEKDPLIDKGQYLHTGHLSWGYWGATEEMWLGGNWARGRALEKGIWKRDPHHNFCSILSGARNFLGGYDDIPQEISIQLWKINPCCPGTKYPLGDARRERVAEVLLRASKTTVGKALNDGNPYQMGVDLGISEQQARKKAEGFENVCLYCDHFFETELKSLKTDTLIELPQVRR